MGVFLLAPVTLSALRCALFALANSVCACTVNVTRVGNAATGSEYFRSLQAAPPPLSIAVDFEVGSGAAAAALAAEASSGSPALMGALTAQLQLAFHSPLVFAYAGASGASVSTAPAAAISTPLALGIFAAALSLVCVLGAAFIAHRYIAKQRRHSAQNYGGASLKPLQTAHTATGGIAVLHLRDANVFEDARGGSKVQRLVPAAPRLDQLRIYADINDVYAENDGDRVVIGPAPLKNAGLPSPTVQRSSSRVSTSSALPLPPSLSPSWRLDAPSSELIISNFHRLLLMSDDDGVAALLARAPGLVNAVKDGQPPLHAAVRAKSLPLVQLLAQWGADLRAIDTSGRTAAEAAAADGAVGMAAWLENAAAAAAPQCAGGTPSRNI